MRSINILVLALLSYTACAQTGAGFPVDAVDTLEVVFQNDVVNPPGELIPRASQRSDIAPILSPADLLNSNSQSTNDLHPSLPTQWDRTHCHSRSGRPSRSNRSTSQRSGLACSLAGTRSDSAEYQLQSPNHESKWSSRNHVLAANPASRRHSSSIQRPSLRSARWLHHSSAMEQYHDH